MKSRRQVEVERNVFPQNLNLLGTGATGNRTLNYAWGRGSPRLSYLRSPDSCSHSPSECGLAWSATEEAVHRPGHLGIQLPISILPPWTLVEISHRSLIAILCFRFLRAGQRLHTAHFITGLCLVLALGPRAEPGTDFSTVDL